MTEIVDQTFLTALPDDKQVKSFVLSEDTDHLEVHAESSNDFEYKSVNNDDVEEEVDIEQKKTPVIQTIEIKDNISQENPSLQPVENTNLQTVFTQSVYDYAAVIYGKSEDPHQHKLNHDVQKILGSGDPPPGFGFLHPKVYYLTQSRPTPMEPLRVWRGYNGNVYFVPINVQQLESNRRIQPTTPRKPTSIRTTPSSSKRPQRSRTIASERRSRKSITNKSSSSRERTSSTKRFQSSHKGYAQTVSSEDEFINNTRTTFSEGEDIQEENNSESKTMWRSVITCMPAPKKPISKRSQHALDDIRAIKQQNILQDPIGSNRPVLPNIRLIPKTKFLYKGLAFKEVKKISGINDENDENNFNPLKRPLVDYNRTQAYIRHEVNAARAKQKPRQTPVPQNINDEQMSRSQTVLDIRETRKRIVKGTTATHYPASKRPGRPERNALLSTEVLVPVRNFSSFSNVPASTSVVSASLPPQNYKAGYTSPMASQNFDVPSIETNLTVSIVQNPEQQQQRPTTAKSSNISQQINGTEMTLLTKYVKRPRSTSRQPPTGESEVTSHK